MSLESMLRTALVVGKTLEISIPTVVDAALGRTTRRACDLRIERWSRFIVEQARIRLTVVGKERLPDRPMIFMSNHESYLDVPVLFATCPAPLRMIAKRELFAVPIWGRAMLDAGFIPVERSGDKEKAKAAMRRAADTIRSGVNLWIAPEGTRRNDGALGKLKRGGFRLAIDTGTPIVPVRLDGVGRLMPRGAYYPALDGEVSVRFDEVIEVEGKTEHELLAAVEARLSIHGP
jgi:1-acyl-sn-glycerol-3-phosphate acyltransferase